MVRLFLDRDSQAYAHWAAMPPGGDKDLLWEIAGTPSAVWLYDDSLTRVREIVAAVHDPLHPEYGTYPVFAVYRIQEVAPATYRRWLTDLANVLGDLPCGIILEPDALASRAAYAPALADAVARLSAAGQAKIYIDAGHPRWVAWDDMAGRLTAAGVAQASGFALNVSNYQLTWSCLSYAASIMEHLGMPLGCVIDTSRNGQGPGTDPNDVHNLPGAGLGLQPGPIPGHADRLGLWVKRPGESDGPHHGGPPAGTWWPEEALRLAANREVPII